MLAIVIGLILVFFGVSLIHGYASSLGGLAAIGGGVVVFLIVAVLAVRGTAKDSFWRRYFAIGILFIFSGALFYCAVYLEPEIGPPGKPDPPNVTFVASGNLKRMQELEVRVAVRTNQQLSGKAGSYDCELAKFTEADHVVKSTAWSVRIRATPGAQVMPRQGSSDGFLSTTMREEKESKDYISFFPRRPLPASPHVDQTSICWPSSKHLFVTERGSSAIIQLSGVYIKQGDTSARLPGKPVKITAVLLKVHTDDWMLDTGPPLSPGSGNVIRQWIYQIDTSRPIYMHFVLVRAHSVEKVAAEHLEEFQSGVLFGVAAATLGAALAELFIRLTEKGPGAADGGTSPATSGS
ncbi:hypothetical protein ACFCVY_14010 [Streptomyces sp. NPDC056411]|uniref:hypothetical protein n=1 Tax=Streptomyces sp. NPDC056411 TaxID=3345813 RepID=UPI0035DDFF43